MGKELIIGKMEKYRRETSAGQFMCINKYLIHELMELKIWNSELRDNIILNNGSVQQIDGISEELKNRYKTSWEISQKFTINQDADRAPFVDQSQSSNRYLGRNTKSISSVTSMDMYAWFKRLKTGQYYLRTQDFTDPEKCSNILIRELVIEGFQDLVHIPLDIVKLIAEFVWKC